MIEISKVAMWLIAAGVCFVPMLFGMIYALMLEEAVKAKIPLNKEEHIKHLFTWVKALIVFPIGVVGFVCAFAALANLH